MNSEDIKIAIDADITTNGSGGITGSILNGILTDMLDMDIRTTGTITDGPNSPNEGALSADFVNRGLYDGSEVQVMDFANRVLLNGLGNTSIDFQSGYLYNSAGTNVLSYQDQVAYSTGVIPAYDWLNGHLFDDAGVLVFDLPNRQVSDSSEFIVADFQTGVLNSSGDGTSVDFYNRILYSSFFGVHASLDYGERVVLNVSGDSIFSWATAYPTFYSNVGTTDRPAASHSLPASMVGGTGYVMGAPVGYFKFHDSGGVARYVPFY